MNAPEKTLARAVPDSLAPPSGSAGWRTALPLLVLTLGAIVALYWPTAQSIVAIWDRSETFAHGFLIVPIVLYLLWTRRKLIAQQTPVADWLGAGLLALAGMAWLVANAGKVQVVQQFAFVAMIPAAVIAIAGRRAAWAMAFPLAFLFLGVPVGEGLIPPLMDFTADFTVAALKLSGMPVYREGTFFMIPSGQWSVVEGCSGLRYLIASITVGTLYAYLSYQDIRKRVIFIALSVIVPIIANGLRAYMIVMIAHLSDMKLALGIDHLIYGWVFFGIVMLLLFWIGSYWRDPEPTIPTSVPLTAAQIREAGSPPDEPPSAGRRRGTRGRHCRHLAAVRRLARPLADRCRGDAGAACAQRWLDARPDADHRLAAAVFRADRRGLPDLPQWRSHRGALPRLLPASGPGIRVGHVAKHHGGAEASGVAAGG